MDDELSYDIPQIMMQDCPGTPVHEEIDRCARAYGWEVGRGKPMDKVIETSPDNPFMDIHWRTQMELGDPPEFMKPEEPPLDDRNHIEQQTLLYGTTDAMVWAEEFMKNFGDKLEQIDIGLMVGWFANAMVTAERHAVVWEDAGSIDCDKYTGLECYVAGALSTMAPFDKVYSPRALPFARKALEALDTWEPSY